MEGWGWGGKADHFTLMRLNEIARGEFSFILTRLNTMPDMAFAEEVVFGMPEAEYSPYSVG